MTQNINQNIKANIVLLIDENGNNIGSINIDEALRKAKLAGLDLVEVSSNSKEVQVCRIMDFGKWKYEQTKRIKKNKVHQKQEMKELKFRPTTGYNDLKYRAKQVDQFINRGDKVKLVVQFKGREQEHMLKTGRIVIDKFLNLISVPYLVETNINIEGNCIMMILIPEKK